RRNEMKLSTLFTTAAFVVALLTGLTSCSNAQETSGGTTSYKQNLPENSFTFRDDGNNWRVDFEEGEIAALYKNGERVPQGEISSYESMIYDNINKLRKGLRKTDSDIHVFKFDVDNLKDYVKEMKKNLRDNLPGKIKIEIDKAEFNK